MCHPEDLKSGEYLLVSLQHSQALGTPLAEPLIYPARPAPVLVLNPGIQPVRFYVREGLNGTYHLTVLGGRNVRENPENRRVFAYDDSEVEEYEINYVPNQLAYTVVKPGTDYAFTVPRTLREGDPEGNQVTLTPLEWEDEAARRYQRNQLFAFLPLPAA